jgi:haloacetate dehalogenase
MFFPGFTLDTIMVGDVALRVRHGGSGPPLLLLHGHPRTHATWHRVAPLLAERFTVVCPDLRGYGRSTVPPDQPNHAQASKRAMAADAVALMTALGHERFAVAGHDRGGYVAFRTALDHPRAITHLAVLDDVPIGDALARCDATFAERWWHWFFLAQPSPKPERTIGLDPDGWYRASRASMGAENYADFRRAIHDPATVHAMCEDYRAGLSLDRAHDDADRRSGRRIACPVRVLWAVHDDLPDLYGDVLAVWRTWADDVSGRALDCGHHISEEAPDELAGELRAFLATAARACETGVNDATT